jgi:hypothetical protein
LVSQSTPDKLEEELKSFNASVLQTLLSKEQEDKLREVFAARDAEAQNEQSLSIPVLLPTRSPGLDGQGRAHLIDSVATIIEGER